MEATIREGKLASLKELSSTLVQKSRTALASLSRRHSDDIQSPVPHLLRTNDPPSPEEILLIQDLVRETAAELRSVAVADVVRATELQRVIFVHEALLSPWRNLPPELLRYICLLTANSSEPGPTQRLPVVSQVCRLWRNISLDASALWSDISIDFASKPISSKRSNLLNLLLERSRRSLLRVYISVIDTNHMNNRILQELLDLSDRWQTARLRLSAATLHGFAQLRGDFTSLCSLEIAASSNDQMGNATIDTFLLAPKLRYLTLSGDWGSTDFLLPYDQLQSYKAVHLDISQVHPLERLPSIVTLDVEWGNMVDFTVGDMHVAPTLEKIRVTFHSPIRECAQSFFGHLILPNIKEIRIDNHMGRFIQPVASLLSRSSLPSTNLLREFVCRAPVELPCQIAQFLQLVPRLEVLDIWIPSPQDLARIAIAPYRRPLAPNLHTLRLVVASVSESASVICGFAANRCEWKDGTRPRGEGKTYSRVRTLKNFTIEIRSQVLRTDSAEEARESLELKNEAPVAPGRHTAAKPGLWRFYVMEALPSIFRNPNIKSTRQQLKLLDAHFSNIERFELSDVRELYASRLHLALNRIRACDKVPGDKKYSFKARAGRILKRWEPLLHDDVENRRWMVVGHSELKYVARGDGGKRRSENDHDIIYGCPSSLSGGLKS